MVNFHNISWENFACKYTWVDNINQLTNYPDDRGSIPEHNACYSICFYFHSIVAYIKHEVIDKGDRYRHFELHSFQIHSTLFLVCRCDATSASDYVEFSNFMARDRKYSRHCGQLKDFEIESDRKFFRVTFWSNDRLDGTGFNATYHFIDDVDPANTVRPTQQASRAPSPTVQGQCCGWVTSRDVHYHIVHTYYVCNCTRIKHGSIL